ncbi:MAG: hypothetical protein GYB26_08400 [Gammaproteobacteria bacterium]|uniref:Uncharacterized protein n=1 Tax=Marinobacter litoralis TaxID=187981 RepID=A0A3M2RM96_9GAMM|nr:hypothetical protein [Marinobacter litoralis]MBR9871144.1 hypothetical protein [Gammaproteobacteria bacterium]RMJ06401.1 hypothetical protein DOQ08_01088 [Marinobacter litoralis]
MMTKLNPLIYAAFALGLALGSGAANAEPDLDVTMRMVMDDESLDDSFVQEMELPDSVNELTLGESFETPDIDDFKNEALEMQESLASEARETRDALELELPEEQPSDLPELELTEPELPSIELPTDNLPDPDLELPIDTPVELPQTTTP